MPVVKVNARGSNLGTRSDGRIIRNEIMQKTTSTEKVILDFSGVDMVSGSFADETLGKIIEEHGFAFLKDSISIVNSNETVTLVLKQAMRDRLMKPVTTPSS